MTMTTASSMFPALERSETKREADLYAMPRNLVLAASAGTGKTHALVGVVVHLLMGGRPDGAVDASRIVATTFSRKAASEIRVRVASEVLRLVLDPAASVYAKSLRESIGGGGGGGERGVSDSDLTKRAKKVLARLPHARFGTLHSFATGLVQRYAVELGLGPGFELATEADARARSEDAIAHALEKRLAENPNALRTLAEAAGGIDRLVSSFRRALMNLEEDGRSARDLEIDTTDARLIDAQMSELVAHAKNVVTFPRCSEAARGLMDAWTSKDPNRIEQASGALAGLRAVGKKPPEVEAFFVYRNDLLGTTNEEKGRRLARSWRSKDAFAKYGHLVRDVLAEAEIDIERTGRARAVLGFGEILRGARELLRDRPDVADEVSSGIDALLVDEFQDTSRVQRDLLQLLWARSDARSKSGIIPPLSAMRGQGLLVVGDRKQSIYGFRGADVGVFAELAVGLAGAPARDALGIPIGVTWEPKEPLADFHALRHNRRSVPSILAFANQFSAQRFQVGDPPPELFEIEYVPATEDLLYPPSAPAVDESGPAVTWLRVRPKGGASTRLEEALVIAQKVKALHAADGPLKIGKDRRAPEYRDIAVLATTNGMLDAVAFALAQANMPYVVAGKSFFRAREISDLAAMLSVILDPHDRIALLEVLRGPWASIHDETLLGLVLPGKGIVAPALWSTPPTPSLIHAEDRPALDALASLIEALGRCATRLGAGAILREAIASTGFESVLLLMPRGEQRVANVQKLLMMADRHPDARAFRKLLEDAKEQEVAESEAATFSDADDAVRLLTVHASKGLDFPIVFVPEIGAPLPRAEKGVARVALGAGEKKNVLSVRIADEEGFVLEAPSYTRAYQNTRRRERAERQRLAYVAITRAADAMFLVGGRSRETVLDPGASTLGVLEQLPTTHMEIEDCDVPTMERRVADVAAEAVATKNDVHETPQKQPSWRSLPIAPTALADFAHCPRRFELLHLLGLPERALLPLVLRADDPEMPAKKQRDPRELDARAQGSIAHAVLERLPLDAFVDPEAALLLARRILDIENVPEDHPQHRAILGRAMRFLRTSYLRSLREGGVAIMREVAFVLPIAGEERTITLRGNMDLVAQWPDGIVDVIDYKSARSGALEGHAFQLDIYALAARARFPNATQIRAGLAFLGGGSGEPIWHDVRHEKDVMERITKLGTTLAVARFDEVFPRVPLVRCELIHCGFIGRCHPDPVPDPDP